MVTMTLLPGSSQIQHMLKNGDPLFVTFNDQGGRALLINTYLQQHDSHGRHPAPMTHTLQRAWSSFRNLSHLHGQPSSFSKAALMGINNNNSNN